MRNVEIKKIENRTVRFGKVLNYKLNAEQNTTTIAVHDTVKNETLYVKVKSASEARAKYLEKDANGNQRVISFVPWGCCDVIDDERKTHQVFYLANTITF